MISAASRDHIVSCVDKAEAGGAEVLVDGRGWAKRQPGTWVGPTVILRGAAAGGNGNGEHAEEIFGPVLMVVKVGVVVAEEVVHAWTGGSSCGLWSTLHACVCCACLCVFVRCVCDCFFFRCMSF